MTEEKNNPRSCDWVPDESCKHPAPAEGDNRSAVYPFREDYSWEGVKQEGYKSEEGSWSAIGRNVLIGNRGESAPFDLRYFEIAPGGYSSLEKHDHEHVVVGIRGRGQALLSGKIHEVGFLDTLYLSPGDPHQLINPHEEPFGFFCIVSHDRDRPVSLDEGELASLLRSPAGGIIRP